MPDDDEGWPMSPGTPQIEVNARCTTCGVHLATAVRPEGADPAAIPHVAVAVARHDPAHAIEYTTETLDAALARREREAAEREAADALAHEQMLARMRNRQSESPAGVVWPF